MKTRLVFASIILVCVVLLLYFTFMVEWPGAKALAVLFVGLVTLWMLKQKHRRLSAFLVCLSTAAMTFAALWLKPAGMITDTHLVLLALATAGASLWNQYRARRVS
jgi:hypothetical protein